MGKAARDGTRKPVSLAAITPSLAVTDFIAVERREYPVVFQEGVWRHVERCRDAEEIVKADIVGAGAERFRVIRDLISTEAQVPFAYGCRRIALLAEHRGDR